MSRIIPNEQSWIGFTTTRPADLAAPTVAELAAATDITDFVISINAQTQGNTVPTPNIKRKFETNIPGTVQATFTADMYRDDEADDAWGMFPRDAEGYVLISRFGGTGVDNIPEAGQELEVWPIAVTSRAASNLASNTAQTFTLTCSVPEEPEEEAVVAASSLVPGAPTNVEATATAATTATVDWDAPSYVGAGLTSPYYAVYKASTVNGVYTLCTATITGTTAAVTGLTTATTSFFKVLAHNAAGDGPLSIASASVTQP
jgi:hypothetical protein